jgi:hypothetical protein
MDDKLFDWEGCGKGWGGSGIVNGGSLKACLFLGVLSSVGSLVSAVKNN